MSRDYLLVQIYAQASITFPMNEHANVYSLLITQNCVLNGPYFTW